MQLKKSLGQNFLVDENVLTNFVDSMELNGDDIVLEVGAGDGRVTKEIAKKAKKVIAVEFDRDLIPALKNNLKDFNKVEIINTDILDFIPSHPELGSGSELNKTNNKIRFRNKFGMTDRIKIVGSIPYSITSPLLHKILTLNPKPLTLNLVIQLEVAEKIVSRPPKATYLSNLVALFGKAEIIEKIPPAAFYPVPKVYSAILKIVPTQESEISNQKSFLNLIHKGFQHPRKMLNKVFKKELLIKVGINSNLRPANLSLEDWIRIYRFIGSDPVMPLNAF